MVAGDHVGHGREGIALSEGCVGRGDRDLSDPRRDGRITEVDQTREADAAFGHLDQHVVVIGVVVDQLVGELGDAREEGPPARLEVPSQEGSARFGRHVSKPLRDGLGPVHEPPTWGGRGGRYEVRTQIREGEVEHTEGPPELSEQLWRMRMDLGKGPPWQVPIERSVHGAPLEGHAL